MYDWIPVDDNDKEDDYYIEDTEVEHSDDSLHTEPEASEANEPRASHEADLHLPARPEKEVLPESSHAASSVVPQKMERSVHDFDLEDLEKTTALFKENVSGCCTNRCNEIIPKQIATKHRFNFMELEKREQDLIILGHLQMHRRIKELESLTLP